MIIYLKTELMRMRLLSTKSFCFFCLVFFSLTSPSQNDDDPFSKVLKKPVSYTKSIRTWDELLIKFSKINFNLPNYKIKECNENSPNLLPTGGNRKKMFGVDVDWTELNHSGGFKCVYMISPQKRFLSDREIRMLLTLKDSRQYFKTGMFSGLKLHYFAIQNDICSLGYTTHNDPLNKKLLIRKDICGNELIGKIPKH